MPLQSLGHRLRLIRGNRSQDELAAVLGVHKNTIGKYERGERQPESEVLARMRLELGVDINWLLTGEGKPDQRTSADAPSNAGSLDETALKLVVREVETYIAERGLIISAEKKAELIITFYYVALSPNAGSQQFRRAVLEKLVLLAS